MPIIMQGDCAIKEILLHVWQSNIKEAQLMPGQLDKKSIYNCF